MLECRELLRRTGCTDVGIESFRINESDQVKALPDGMEPTGDPLLSHADGKFMSGAIRATRRRMPPESISRARNPYCKEYCLWNSHGRATRRR